MTSAAERGEWSVSNTGRLSRGQISFVTLWLGCWVDLRACLDTLGKRKVPWSCQGTQPRFLCLLTFSLVICSEYAISNKMAKICWDKLWLFNLFLLYLTTFNCSYFIPVKWYYVCEYWIGNKVKRSSLNLISWTQLYLKELRLKTQTSIKTVGLWNEIWMQTWRIETTILVQCLQLQATAKTNVIKSSFDFIYF